MNQEPLPQNALYDLIENEDGTLAVKIHEGVTSLVEYPLMPSLFAYNDKVTQVWIPDSLETAYVHFPTYFPHFKRVRGKKTNTHWGNFKFEDGYFCSAEHPVSVPPNVCDNGDGTYTLDVPEGVCAIHDLANWDIYHRVSVLRIPASLQEITLDMSWYFDALQEVCVHPDNPHFIVEDGVLFTADKKKMILYPRAKAGDTYHVDDAVEVIGIGCFAELDHLKNIYIGKGVRKIEHCALDRDMRFHLNKIYIPPTVTELEGEIFDAGGDDAGTYYPIEVVGGAGGSAIEAYCNHRGIDFVAIAEDEVEGFYASTVEELRQRAMEQAEQQTEYWVEDRDKGYRMHVANGTLEVTALDDISVDGVVISDTRDRIGKYHRKQVKALIIGAGITAIDNLAFDDYEALESIAIGPDVCRIEPAAFNGRNERAGNGCCKVSTITVDERNGWYTAVDNVLYTADMTTLVKYAPKKPDLYHGVDARVRHIGDCAFEHVTNLQCLKVGEGCVSVGERAFVNTGENLRHVYFAASVTDWPEVHPFLEEYGFDCWRSNKLVIGAPEGSTVQACCASQSAWFYPLEEQEITDFMATPLPDTDEDTYLLHCSGGVLVDEPDESAPAVICDGELPF